MKINFKTNSVIMDMIQKAPYFKKVEKTFFRKAREDEFGKTLVTYVKNPNSEGFRKEAEILITPERLIARNNLILGYRDSQPIFNEWTKPICEVLESYGQHCLDSLTYSYQEYEQIKPIKLLKLTPDIMDILGNNNQNQLLIDVSWSDKPMIALLGDYITENGYSISQVDVNMQYLEVKKAPKSLC